VLLTGWALGGAAGYLQGAVDSAVIALAEIFLTVPWLFLLLAVRAALPLGLPPRLAFLTLVLLIALTSWARPALLVRALVLSLSAKGYVTAALALGVPRWRVFLRHILPATAGLFLTQAVLLVPRFVLAEVTLTYLGLGSGLEASWGALLLPLKQFYLLESQWWKGLPALLMIPFFVGMAVVAVEFEKRCSRS
jgi:peptide/nickel transport system permease protein